MNADCGEGQSDADLVFAAQSDPDESRRRSATAELLRRFGPRVYGLCRKYARDTDRALDLSQEVLLAAFRALDTFEGRAPFSAWIFAIARHRCIRAMRVPSWTRDEGLELSHLVDPSPGADVQMEVEEEQRLVQTLIDDCLEPLERKALFLRCVECLPVEEITRVLEIQQASGARGVLQTARRKLRAALQARGLPAGGKSRD